MNQRDPERHPVEKLPAVERSQWGGTLRKKRGFFSILVLPLVKAFQMLTRYAVKDTICIVFIGKVRVF